MGQYEVWQRTQDGYFNATLLLKQWNKSAESQKRMEHFFENQSTKEFIEVLENELSANNRNSGYLRTRGNKGATWMHPYLFIDFAMWINPRFKLAVIRFVYDQLIQFRHSAGDNYRSLTRAVAKLPNADYGKLAIAINYVVFGRHGMNLRQQASEEQLSKLTDIENKLSYAVDMGLIKTFPALIEHLRKLYKATYGVKSFYRKSA